jgi:hypothetical protein
MGEDVVSRLSDGLKILKGSGSPCVFEITPELILFDFPV